MQDEISTIYLNISSLGFSEGFVINHTDIQRDVILLARYHSFCFHYPHFSDHRMRYELHVRFIAICCTIVLFKR